MLTLPVDAIRTPRDLAPFLDHTVLAPGATAADALRACAEARQHGFAAVCVRPEVVAEVRAALRGSPVLTAAVVDFPRGEGTTAARVAEAAGAVARGAEELDLVVRLPALLAGRFEEVLHDLRAVVRASAPVPVKVILETARLDRDLKVAGAALARCAGAAFVKTSTGFGGGATAEDVALLRAVVGEGMGVKASGGIRTAADALAMIRAGASRVGASASVAIVSGTF